METRKASLGGQICDIVKCDCHGKAFFLPELEPEDISEIHEHQWKQYSECVICGAVSEEPLMKHNMGWPYKR